ncbi:hypothetical protein [Microbulbifer sp. THAF38]|uniref:hypothetical protein n=1 Tax=Microbulbifer sp. THAF38 TaxID=2587856 RepID=UPI001269215F|nr:hypothetical protein [Microbulbifer sp. THAF38]
MLKINEAVESSSKVVLYRYGFYLDPQPNDPALTNLVEAESQAKRLSAENDGIPVAIWDDADKTLKLFAGYEDFIPVDL